MDWGDVVKLVQSPVPVRVAANLLLGAALGAGGAHAAGVDVRAVLLRPDPPWVGLAIAGALGIAGAKACVQSFLRGRSRGVAEKS